ncbi:FAD-dependent oxidoreductase [Nocardia sp. NPDC048505]|uniref:NAD(P)/FAD-dependent oxidoreductase n=1 Tax=Nocardia sp. NPDC048505 TaxID=3155756 RepID=UPI0033CE5CA8
MSEILVVGGGFAGVWAAAAAQRLVGDREVSVTLVAPGPDLVIRPRLYQAEPERMRVPLDRVLGPIGVRRVAATVDAVDAAQGRVRAVGSDGRDFELTYDRMILATGSRLVRPNFPGAELMHDVDTLPAATALDAHLHRLPAGPGACTAVVVGAGFTGLEIATELVTRMRAVAGDRRVRVVLVEQAEVVGPELGPGPRPHIEAVLAKLGVEQRLSVRVTAVDVDGVTLSDGSHVPAATVVWTAGVQAGPLTTALPGSRDHLGRLAVDAYLRVPAAPAVYAAGDTAATPDATDTRVLPCCQHALQLGRYAGHNAAADLLGRAPVPFVAEPYVTCLDLGATDAVFTTGWERRVVATGAAAKERKRNVNERFIYPPVDDPDELLRQADYRFSVRQLART